LCLDWGEYADVLHEFTRSGIDIGALSTRLQEAGATAFVISWKDLLGVIAPRPLRPQAIVMTASTLPG
jgi:hypothetical protein